jgi:hypothetical protein
MPIPAGDDRVVHEVVRDPRAFWDFAVGDLDLSAGFDVHSVLLHMHRAGAEAEAWIEHADGTTEILARVPRYDFDWQLVYRLAEPARFENGDVLGVRCVFDNEGGEALNWGEGTDEEMCVANLYVSAL